MAARQRSRRGDLDPQKESLAQLSNEVNEGVPSEAVLGQLQTVLEGLRDRSQSYLKQLEGQLSGFNEAALTVRKELSRRNGNTNYDETSDQLVPKQELSNDSLSGTSSREQAGGEPMDDVQHDASNENSLKTGSELEKSRDGKGRGKSKSHLEVTDNISSKNAHASSQNANVGSSNQKFVPNPKSEFVDAQALPIGALGLFEENSDDEEEAALKKRLGVVSFPTKDLSEFLPGPLPEGDFTRGKPPNQVQLSTFSSFLEPYFRPWSEEDLGFLQQRNFSEVVSFGRAISPYVIPPLGPPYPQNWVEEDQQMAFTDNRERPPRVNPPVPPSVDVRQFFANGAPQDLTDANVEQGTVGLGPLTARLVTALLPEDHEDDDAAEGSAPPQAPAVSMIPKQPQKGPMISDFSSLEERLKREFRYVGIVDLEVLRKFAATKRQFKLAHDTGDIDIDDPGDIEIDWVNGLEDDEICRELRFLQEKLGEVSAKNIKFKRRLLPVIQEQMAWQEYSNILADLDKQIDQAYSRRLKMPKQKKKVTKDQHRNGNRDQSPAPATPDSSSTAVDNKPMVNALLEKRRRWINKIGSVFRPPRQMLCGFEDPKFEGIDDDADEDEE